MNMTDPIRYTAVYCNTFTISAFTVIQYFHITGDKEHRWNVNQGKHEFNPCRHRGTPREWRPLQRHRYTTPETMIPWPWIPNTWNKVNWLINSLKDYNLEKRHSRNVRLIKDASRWEVTKTSVQTWIRQRMKLIQADSEVWLGYSPGEDAVRYFSGLM